MFSQIGETEDQTGRRRGRYTAEQLLQVMENNIEASLFTWSTAIAYQQEKPDSPLFVIANERTGPADLAAEYLPQKFADQFKVSQSVDYDKFFEWFRQNGALVESLYERHRQGEDMRDAVPAEVLSFLDIDSHAIIPIYRLKVPSSLDAAYDEPEGINTVLNFLKFISILGGRTLFMDESTRSAPRSIECLYNVLNRRQEALGGARIRLFGKINGVQGQSGTTLQEVTPETSQIEIGFIDPWHSQVKSVTDDSVGFVPEVQGKGVVEVIRPSYTSVSPYGISTVQDFWKQLIANEVSLRFEGFEESGGAKKRKEEFKPTPKSEEILTQEDLQRMAFEKPYRALVLDLDGTVGSRGQYNPRVIEKIKELAGNGVDVVIGTSRSLIDHSEYDGSAESFIEQLGELSDVQKSHIHLATENGAVISTLGDLGSPHEQHLLSNELASTVGSILTSLPATVKMYREKGTLVLRGFDQDGKQEFMDSLRREINRLGLPLKVGSDSKHSIHIRVAEASRRNILNWLESRGVNINDIAKIGDSPEGNDRPMFWGRGSFNVGDSRAGTLWTIHQSEHGGGLVETEELLKRLVFVGH
jgi:hydroxymethylpyrimidine pyrophosphatase-like HAD family hydrolase